MLGITSEIPYGLSSEINCCYHCTDIFLFNSSLHIMMGQSDKSLYILSARPSSIRLNNCARCKDILMTFLCLCISFEYSRLIGLDDLSTLNLMFYLTMSISCTSGHRNTNPLVGTRISTDGNRANYARKTRETDENLKRNERCDNTEILFWPHGPLRSFISCFVLITPLYFSN